MDKNKHTYLSLNFKLDGHPIKKDIFYIVDETCINTSLKMLLNTNFYERPFNCEYGANLRALLFELSTTDIESVTRDRVISKIQKWEPRVEVINVLCVADEHQLTVSIYYRLLNKTEVSNVSISLRLNQ